jgi:hypothetical protein
LLRGQWSELWRSSGRLPFAKRKGEMFALIGERLGNLNAHTCAQLPAGWTILHQLARLPRPVLEKLIADGDVHPALKLGAAKALVAKFVHGKKHGARPYQLTRRLRDFKKFILSSAEEWTDREQRMVCKTLEELARQLTAPAFSAGFSLSHEPIVWTTTLDATLTT